MTRNIDVVEPVRITIRGEHTDIVIENAELIGHIETDQRDRASVIVYRQTPTWQS